MSATGGNAPGDVIGMLTKTTAQVTVGTGDITIGTTVFTCGIARRVVPQANGTVFIQRSGDSTAFSYVAQTGVPIDGEIALIGGTTNFSATNGLVLNLEL